MLSRVLLRAGAAAGGLAVFSLGMVLTIQANLGVASWQAFHLGLTNVSSALLGWALTFGQASALTSIVMIVVSLAAGIRPHVATILNVVVVPPCVDAFLAIVPRAHSLPAQVLLLFAGVGVMGFGTALYIRPQLGAGPRDSFMLALVAKTGWRIAVVRTGIEVVVLTLGFLMGAPVGIGTAVISFGIGPTVGWFFRLLRVPVKRPAVSPQPSVISAR